MRSVMSTTTPDDAILVTSYNVRRPVPEFLTTPADRWSRRAPNLVSALRRERPAILAAQEVLPHTARTILAALGPTYRRYGVGRGRGGRGEGCPIFFDSERLHLVAGRQVALSDDPDTAGSRGWGNPIPRVATTAVFRDRRTGKSLGAVNTHLDPFSERSRLRSALALRQLAADSPHPTVLFGDLNAGASSRTVRTLLADGLLADAWTRAERRLTPAWRSFARYRRPRLGNRIDWICATAGIRVLTAAIEHRPETGGWPSDHLPVYAAIEVDS